MSIRADKHRLPDLQRWMMDAITHPDGPRTAEQTKAGSSSLKGEKVHAVIGRSKNLTSLERINIYYEMYYLRLIEILEGDFPALRYAVGEDEFSTLAKDFLVAHPSRYYDLSMLGAKFPKFLRGAKNLKHRSFLADLAKLERSVEEVFDDTHVKSLKTDELLSIPQQRWADARIGMIPALRLISSRFPINGFMEAYRKEAYPQIPAPKPNWVCIYRRNYEVWRKDLDHPEYAILTALAKGKTVGEALAGALELPEMPKDVGAAVTGWFKNWAANGFFSKIELAK